MRAVLSSFSYYCRKKKAVHKTTSTDDKRLQNTLKRLGVNTIPGIEEVNIVKDDSIIHFANPKGAFSSSSLPPCLQQRWMHARACAGAMLTHTPPPPPLAAAAFLPPQSKHPLQPTPTW